MSQTFTDENLLTWEAFASGGRFGLSIRPKVIFHCVSDRSMRARFVELQGDEADAEDMIHDSSVDQLRQMLAQSKELD
ncbi:MAG: hypothetical protein AVDCRST_MAG89-1953 [uncultured Gemmatimonadetes bacterium]|jgi:hypothetical protein|uniref:Uncharacterized protein n=1 Tax=uncultured Gemmatimonadota bacterium TaxID=203437 RepID=A0A6J4LB93_9BACT|nr:MAG: hypothetical protein AVDCRST_MAG89-1953 [uncultured Gemmatimonadota bacterium]